MELSLAINEVDTTCDVAIAMNAYKDYGLEFEQAQKVREQVDAAVGAWREVLLRRRVQTRFSGQVFKLRRSWPCP